MTIAWPALQPFDLVLTSMRLNPGSAVANAMLLFLLGWLFFWLQYQLGHPSIKEAVIASGRRVRSAKYPIAIGVLLVGALSIVVPIALRGENAEKAVSIARREIGENYRYTVTSMKTSTSKMGTSVSAIVTAWNHTEIRTMPVSWSE